MRIKTAMLADAARVESGKLYIHGGGWDNISTGSLPVIQPSLALVLTLQVEYDEALRDLPLSISLIDEDGEKVGFNLEGELNVGHPPKSKRGSPVFIHQALTLNMLKFDRAGGYCFVVKSGDEELGSVPFQVILVKTGQSQREPTP